MQITLRERLEQFSHLNQSQLFGFLEQHAGRLVGGRSLCHRMCMDDHGGCGSSVSLISMIVTSTAGPIKTDPGSGGVLCRYLVWDRSVEEAESASRRRCRRHQFVIRTRSTILTTEAALLEWLNAMSDVSTRRIAAESCLRIRADAHIEVVPFQAELMFTAIGVLARQTGRGVGDGSRLSAAGLKALMLARPNS